MSEPQSNPRRRPLYKSSRPPLATSARNNSSSQHAASSHPMSLRKGATFHSPSTSPTEETDPVLNLPTILRRSPTAPKSLEDVIADRERRVAAVLGNVDRTFAPSSENNSSSPSSPASDEDPVPRGILDGRISRTDDSTSVDDQPKKPALHRNRYSSDSGLGSSISGALDMTELKGAMEDISRQTSPKAGTETTTKRRSKPTLSAFAFKKVEHHVLRPLYCEKRLKPFHSLVKEVPRLVVDDQIQCLRDVEKHLVHNAGRYAPSGASYINFCQFAVQCIYTTVTHLHERDQRRPADRAYTNGYFLDMVQQIHQYAASITAARDARARARSDSNSLDYESGEELVLEGGITHNGRPAELVRKKQNGQKISLETNAPYEEKPDSPVMKRSLSTDSADDSVLRSMARRKKDAPPLNINKKCAHCEKIFRRPCDLTKHEKTHSRPWKCPERGCKYFEFGWPTEKERDRHLNDKHSAAPKLFRCHFKPCTYTSKRDSNCKQHMEKAHGWTYVRSKNNGKTGGSTRGSVQATPQTPAIDTPVPTPQSALMPSPYTSTSPYEQAQPAAMHQQPMTTEMGERQPSVDDFPLFPEVADQQNLDYNYSTPFDFDNFHSTLRAGDPDQFLPSLDNNVPSVPSSNTSNHDGNADHNTFGQSPSIFDNFSYEIDWDSLDNEYTMFNAQLMTPQSAHTQYQDAYGAAPYPNHLAPQQNQHQHQHQAPGKVSSLSPNGQGNLMLYTPSMEHEDEGFHEGFHEPMKKQQQPMGDFTLFGNPMDGVTPSATAMGGREQVSGTGSSSMFPSLHNVGEQHGNPAEWEQPMEMTLDVGEFMRMDSVE